MSDPKLLAAAEEIKELLNKHDIAGVCVLSSPGNSEYIYHFTASWSCAFMEGKLLRFRSLRSDFPNTEKQIEKTANTISMLVGFVNILRNTAEELEKMVKLIGGKLDFTIFVRKEKRDPDNT